MKIIVQHIDDLGIFIEYEEDASVANLETEQKFEAMAEKLKSIGLKMGTNFSVKKAYEKFIKDLRNDSNT